jgi:hydroxyethylthiazole kinase-like uncharacterized protein yjeF
MIPLFTAKQNRLADAYAVDMLGLQGPMLMENASRSVFLEIQKEFPEIDNYMSIGILTGRGNNGGDGFTTARHFINNGYYVKILALADDKSLKGDALLNFNATKNLIKQTNSGEIILFKSSRDLNKLNDCSVIIDALLGTGAAGKLRAPYDKIITKANEFNAIRVAIDVPSGLNADTGSGDIVFDADLTVALGGYKRGLFFEKGKAYSGKVVKGYIGIGEEYFESQQSGVYLIEPEDAFESLPVKTVDLNKYSAGKVLTIAGSGKYVGAGIFSASSVFYSGGGASLLAVPKSVRNYFHDENVGLIFIPYEKGNEEFLTPADLVELKDKLEWADAVTIGPGLGREGDTQSAILELIKMLKGKRVVLDADGLYPMRNGGYKKQNLKNFILTPHQKEFSDLLGISLKELKEDVLKYGSEFSVETGSYLVLKGAPTIIFNPDGEAFINTTGNAGMAKFGSGDVLSGVIASFLAQSKDAEDAAIAGVYIHSLSADLLRPEKTTFGFTAKDIMLNLPHTIKFLDASVI